MAVTRRTAIRSLVAAAAGITTGAGVYGYAVERHRLHVTRVSLPISGLPRAFAGFRVGFLTDVHLGPFFGQDDVARAVDLIVAERPDVVALGGDYVNWQDRAAIEPCAEALGALSAPHGVFAVLGNHDEERATTAAFERRRIEMLRDERTRLVVGGEALELAGLRYWTRRVAAIARLLRGVAAPVLLVAHDPRRLAEASALDVGAVLAGHTHGGQIVLPIAGAIAARKFPVASGLARRENTSMFVSRGVGTVVVPFRLNCPPEVAIVTLERRGTL